MLVVHFTDEKIDPPSIPTSVPNGVAEVEKEAYPTMRVFCLTSITVLEKLLLYCTHAIRMRDTRCCGVVLRVFRSIVPEFTVHNTPADGINAGIREYISSNVLKACITSLHEPYFVDLQKDLAQLIASILIYYSAYTKTPREVLLSLPGVSEEAIDQTIDYISRPGVGSRQQRALVLDLLKDLKGVSISEQGRITKPASAVKKERSKMQQEFMKVNQEQSTAVKRGGTPDFEGLAGMFA